MITDPQDELLTQVDKNNIIIGGITRGKAHSSKDVFYRTVYIVIKNNLGEVLLQKRSPTKDLYPNCWDLSVGGHVIFGDSYLETAIRELEEEVGIKVGLEDLVDKGKVLVRLPHSNEFFRVYEYKLIDNDLIQPAGEEISEIKWLSIEDIKKSMKGKTINWYTRPMQIINAIY